MDNANPVGSDDKENTKAHLRNKIENWREERYEKLCSRLLRSRDGHGTHLVSPSVLGMKCPKNLSERVNHQECRGHRERKKLSDLQHLKSGMRPGQVKKFPEGPAIRQTITSKLRVIKNNPFLGIHIENKCGTVDLNETAVIKNHDESDGESPEAIFSTPAIGNNHPQFPDNVSVIKHVKTPHQVLHSKTFLKYD